MTGPSPSSPNHVEAPSTVADMPIVRSKHRGATEPVGYAWLVRHIGTQQEECLLWPFSCKTSGYGQCQYQKKWMLPHRFMCEQKNGPAPEGYLAAHSCGNRRCVNPNHLSWKTHAGNQLDRRIHGTNAKSRTKLTPLQVKQIRQLKGMETSIITAARYSITESNVRLIQEGKTWKLERPADFTSDQVSEIRKSKDSVADLARRHDVSTSAIYRLRAGETYRSIP